MDTDAAPIERRLPNHGGPRVVLAFSTVAASWLLMQVVHESGHVIGALLTGGQIRQVVLVPWEISRTDLLANPHSLIVCWLGPVVGAIAPVIAWLIAAKFWKAGAFWFRFLAGFCLIANGAYIAVGQFTRDGDGGDLMREGSPAWTLWLFGAVCVPIGLLLWHQLGKHFGFGPEAQQISVRKAAISTVLLLLVVFIETAAALLTA